MKITRFVARMLCMYFLIALPIDARPSGGGVAHYDAFVDRDTIHVLIGTGKKGTPDIALWHLRSIDGGTAWSKNGGQSWSAPERVRAGADVSYLRLAATRHGMRYSGLMVRRRGASLIVNAKPLRRPDCPLIVQPRRAPCPTPPLLTA